MTISFTKKRNEIASYNSIGNDASATVTSIKDLVIKFNRKLILDIRISNVANQTFRTLGFILRARSKFSTTFVYVILYYTFVRSMFEFASIYWSQQYLTYIRIELY